MIITDENGNVVDYLAKRNEEIKAKLQPILDEFIAEKKQMAALKKPTPLGYRFSTQIETVLASYGLMSLDDIAHLDYDTIYDYWLKYLDLYGYFNRYIEIVNNKQKFCEFMGINTDVYKNLQESEDARIRFLMKAIDDRTMGGGFTASESGSASPAAIKTRLSAAENAGHNMVSASEKLLISKVGEETSMLDLKRQVEAIIGSEIKLIGDK